LYDHSTGKCRAEGRVDCVKPNANLYQFEGTYTMPSDVRVNLGPKNLLLRGARLKNTEWAVGIAVYTGVDTKIMKNAEKSSTKSSKIEK